MKILVTQRTPVATQRPVNKYYDVVFSMRSAPLYMQSGPRLYNQRVIYACVCVCVCMYVCVGGRLGYVRLD
jgi:hypothetical protein